MRLRKVEASMQNAHAHAIAFFSYIWFKYDILSPHCCKMRSVVVIRGGVEDTRLEAKAKAKDTKKIRGQGQGQGQPFRGQTLSRPRTGMLEDKAKDQGHKAQVLSKKKKKKKVFAKIFQGDLQKKKKKKKKKRSSQKFFKRSPRKNPFQKIFQPLHKILTFQKILLSSSRGQANFRGLEASRPRPRDLTFEAKAKARTSKSVLEDVLEAKDVLEDSTSGGYNAQLPTSALRFHSRLGYECVMQYTGSEKEIYEVCFFCFKTLALQLGLGQRC